MSQSQQNIEQPERLLALNELAEILIRHFQIHEGHYELGVSMRIGMGLVPGPEGSTRAPGAFMGVEGVSLRKAQPNNNDGPLTFDAAVVNPAPIATPAKAKSRKKST